jgi:hypothetical protein
MAKSHGPDVNKIAGALRGAASSGVRKLNYRLNGDTVLITGEADTLAAKQQAFRAVTAVVGDIGVVNEIEVRPAAPAAAPPAAPAAGAAAVPVANVGTPASGGGDANAILEAKAREHKGKLDWKHSVVDLMKLLGMDSSMDSRRKLAAKLGYKGDTGDSAKMNMWLHSELMKKVGSGGVPKDLLA